MFPKSSGVRRKNVEAAVQGYGRLRKGSGGGVLRTPESFRKFPKIFLKKITKNALFSPIFQRKCINPGLLIRAFGRIITIVWGNFEKIEIF